MRLDSNTTKEFSYDALTEFNHALVYTLVADEPIVSTDRGHIEFIMYGASQQQGMYQAYLYAQNSILPRIKEVGLAGITPQQILIWMDEIHLRAATSLVETPHKNINIYAGRPSPAQVTIWHEGGDFRAQIYKLIANNKNVNLKSKDLTQFIKILFTVRDQEIKTPADQECFIDDSIAEKTMLKLSVLYHTPQGLSENDKMIIDKFIKICRPPSTHDATRLQFAENLLNACRTLNPMNLDDLSKLAFTVFHGILDGHWYFNGNGRTAVCLMNTLLRAFGRPCIFLKNPAVDNSENNYNKAMQNLDKEPGLLLQHIKNCLLASQSHQDYKNESLAKAVMYRIRLTNTGRTIQLNFPQFKINEFYQTVIQEADRLKLFSNEIKVLIFFCEKFNAKLENLNRLKEIAVLPAPIQKQYDESEKNEILELLTQLSGKQGWKAYKTNGLTVLLDGIDKDSSLQIIEMLNTSNAAKAELKRNAKTKNLVIQVTTINLNALRKLQTQTNSVESIELKMPELKMG